MKIYRISQMDCGGFGPAKGHLDTQLFTDCPSRDLKEQKKHPKKKKHSCPHCKCNSKKDKDS